MVSRKDIRFSPDFNTYEDWLKSQNVTKPYVQRIVRGHSRFPDATLPQLRGHTSKGRKSVSELKERPIYKRSWNSLNKREVASRGKSLEALSKVKEGKSLTRASKDLHTSLKTALSYTNAFQKVKGRWIPKEYDRISRIMSIYENGKQKWIEVRDSRTASKIGKYNNTVKQFLSTGDRAVLKEFNKPIRDVKGNLHYFEINPSRLIEIAEAQEEPEFFEIYRI